MLIVCSKHLTRNSEMLKTGLLNILQRLRKTSQVSFFIKR
jgi:hypothetical protein